VVALSRAPNLGERVVARGDCGGDDLHINRLQLVRRADLETEKHTATLGYTPQPHSRHQGVCGGERKDPRIHKDPFLSGASCRRQ